MKNASIDTIYNDIMLLSDSDRYKIYNRMKKDYFNHSEIVAVSSDGKALTLEQYKKRVQEGIIQCKRGKNISLENFSIELGGYNYADF